MAGGGYVSKLDQIAADMSYLRSQGWECDDQWPDSPWRWYQPDYPGARFVIKDALVVARAGERERNRKKKGISK